MVSRQVDDAASNARHADARVAVSATEAVLVAFGTARHRYEAGQIERCPRCRSYSIAIDDAESGEAGPVCETCGWTGSSVSR